MKTRTLIFVAIAALAVLPFLPTSEPVTAGQSPPGFRVHAPDRMPCETVAPVTAAYVLLHKVAPAPDAVFDLPVENAALLPEEAFVFTLLRVDGEARLVQYPLLL